jgi:hypothetical protein
MEMLIEMPVELKALLGVFVTMFVTQALKWFSESLNVDLSGYSAQVTAALVGSILVLINAALTNVPAELAPIVQSVLGLIVVVLGSFGAYNLLLKDKAKG